MTVDPWAFRRWAFEQETGNVGRKALLAALASMAESETGRCEAKHDTLARWVEISRRSVIRHVEALREAGLIATRRQYRRDGSRRGDEFLLLAPWVTEWPDGDPIQSDTVAQRQSDNGDQSKVPMATNGVLPLSQQERPLKEGPLRNEIPLGSPVEEVWAHYQTTRPNGSRCKLGDAERRMIRNALKVRDIEACKAAITSLFRSDYHVQGGYIGIKYALVGGGRSPDPATTIDRLVAQSQNGRANGTGVLHGKVWPDGRTWDELTRREQENAKESFAIGMEPWRAQVTDWQPERAGGQAEGVTAENFLD